MSLATKLPKITQIWPEQQSNSKNKKCARFFETQCTVNDVSSPHV